MKRNLDLPILNLDGNEFEDKATLKTVIFLAVTTPLETDRHLSMDAKLGLYGLAQKVHQGGVVDLKSEEIAQLKDRIGKAFSHVVVIGRAVELLETDYEEAPCDTTS